MSWIKALLGRRTVRRDSWLVELRTARLRHLLGELGAILDLAADAADKQHGDYILDRHYVVSLAEQALDHADAVLFDLEVIAGTPSLAAAERLLALRHAVASALAQPPSADVPTGGDPADEPEYLLLREVRQELFSASPAGGGDAQTVCCRSLVELALVAAVEAGARVGALLASDAGALARGVQVAAGGAVSLTVVDVGGALAPPAPAGGSRETATVTGAALAALVAGLAEAPAGAGIEACAAATAEHVFFATTREGAHVVIDALIGASPGTSHLFVATRDAADAGGFRLDGQEASRVGNAAVLWRRGLATAPMAAALRAAARLAAGGSGDPDRGEEAI